MVAWQVRLRPEMLYQSPRGSSAVKGGPLTLFRYIVFIWSLTVMAHEIHNSEWVCDPTLPWCPAVQSPAPAPPTRVRRPLAVHLPVLLPLRQSSLARRHNPSLAACGRLGNPCWRHLFTWCEQWHTRWLTYRGLPCMVTAGSPILHNMVTCLPSRRMQLPRTLPTTHWTSTQLAHCVDVHVARRFTPPHFIALSRRVGPCRKLTRLD